MIYQLATTSLSRDGLITISTDEVTSSETLDGLLNNAITYYADLISTVPVYRNGKAVEMIAGVLAYDPVTGIFDQVMEGIEADSKIDALYRARELS